MIVRFDDGCCRYICDDPCDSYLKQDYTDTRDFESTVCVSCVNRLCLGSVSEVHSDEQ